MQPELGIVEGFFGRPWPWRARRAAVAALAPRGYRFYLYAPKADASLRRDWRSQLAHPDELEGLARHCAAHGVRFGVGLTPFGAHLAFGPEERAALADRVAEIDATGATELAILFDDMDGGPADLAGRQAAIVEFAAGRSRASRISVCPSYYSDDPLLDRVFGQRPPRYLETLAGALDPRIGIFWTGEEVCSRELSPGHLDAVAERIGRAPILWDNYPVNDGPTMSQRLHLRGFTGRNARIGHSLDRHAVNPALQPTLSLVPMLTLADCYREGDAYRYREATDRALAEVLGEELASLVRVDLKWLQDVGLDRLAPHEKEALRARYGSIDHEGAREIVAWLDGHWAISGEAVRTQ
jgi:hyaluronoglucosaminidase